MTTLAEHLQRLVGLDEPGEIKSWFDQLDEHASEIVREALRRIEREPED